MQKKSKTENLPEFQKDFLPYPESIKMKKLGFDEPCFGFYQIEYAEIRPTMVDDDEQYRLTGYRTCKNSEIPEHYTSAPTFSQAFRFFRENHNLFSYIELFTNGDNIEMYEFIIYSNQVNPLDAKDCFTYEEAEYACLEKLIEIVEKRK